MTILAAVDGEHESDSVVEVAHDLSRAHGDRLVVVHVMTEEEYQNHGDTGRQYTIEQAEDDAASVAEEVVVETLGGMEGATARGAVGDPADTILEAAEGLEARYVVIGGRRRSPVGKAVFGSTSQDVLLNAERPVVSVMREDGE